jgi:ribonuclease Z
MGFTLTILGCSSATPRLEARPTAQHLKMREKNFLIDCGEGTQIELKRRGIKPNRIDHIFISHLHGDHFFGLPGLISSFHLLDRGKPLHIYAPSGLHEILRTTFRHTNTWLSYAIEFHPLRFDEPERIYEDDKLSVTSVPLQHSIASCGFVFREKPHPRKLKIEEVQRRGIPVYAYHRIKQGADWENDNGESVSNSLLTVDGKKARSYAFCSDTSFQPSIVESIFGVDYLYHESTFLESDKALAKKTKHSTAKEAAEIARLAEVENLVLGHFSARYKDISAFRKEAEEIFNTVELAFDGKRIELD